MPYLRGAGEQMRQVLDSPAFRDSGAPENLPATEASLLQWNAGGCWMHCCARRRPTMSEPLIIRSLASSIPPASQ